MILKGKVHKFGDNINTDEIIAAKYLNLTDAEELGRHCMETIDKKFSSKVKRGDIIIGGRNFGCGSSREHAPISIKGCGISCVLAVSFARIFYRNAINMGLPILECKQVRRISKNSLLEINLDKGIIRDLTSGKIYFAQAFPKFMQELIKSGGLMKWVKKRCIKSP